MRVAIVTGADHDYFPLLHTSLKALARFRTTLDYSLCVLDFGLKPEEIAVISAFDAHIVRPSWWFDISDDLRCPRNLSYAARPTIPSQFPGHDLYLWLDADISVRDDRFLLDFLEAAEDGALAVAEEADPTYRIEPYALKWQVGNAIRCFGLVDGLRLCLARPINSGAFALRADAPHWAAWQRRYRQAVARAGRVNLDQHALLATLCLDGLSVHHLGSTHNWICTRSQPLWDEDRKVFCRPCAPFDPIGVLHLAGRRKSGDWEVKTLKGDVKPMPLTYAGAEPSPGEGNVVGI